MAVGKYSPTVSMAYAQDQSWWDKLPKSDEVGLYDEDGYDSYGYDRNDRDRANNHESDYMQGTWVGDSYEYLLYENVAGKWTFEDGKPKVLVDAKKPLTVQLVFKNVELSDKMKENLVQLLDTMLSDVELFVSDNGGEFKLNPPEVKVL